MRLGFGCVALAFMGLATACTDRVAQLTTQWGCGTVDGLKRFTGAAAPNYILIGEFTETNEAPAAFAELACNLAARQEKSDGPLFVGVSQYFGGATEAEKAMVVRLDQLKSKGAPIVVGPIGGSEHAINVRNRNALEKEWSTKIMAKVEAAGASRGLFLMPRADATAAPLAPAGERFAGYSPMATNLPEGRVIALEIAGAPTRGLDAPAIRFYPKMTEGFDGQIALVSLTRPLVEADLSSGRRGAVSPKDNMLGFLEESGQPHEKQLAALTAYFEVKDGQEAGRLAERRQKLAEEIKDPAMIDILAPPPEADVSRLRPDLRAEAEVEMWDLAASERKARGAVIGGELPPEFVEIVARLPEFRPALESWGEPENSRTSRILNILR